MKTLTRIWTVVTTLAVTAVFGVTSALAQPDYPPTVEPTTVQPGGPGPKAGGEVAFTGLRLTVWMALLAGLVAIGLVTYFMGRRRAASDSSS